MNLLEIRDKIAFSIGRIEVEEPLTAIEVLNTLVKYLDTRFSYQQMADVDFDTDEEKSKKFNDFLTKTSAEVKTWPEWKRNILGGIKH